MKWMTILFPTLGLPWILVASCIHKQEQEKQHSCTRPEEETCSYENCHLDNNLEDYRDCYMNINHSDQKQRGNSKQNFKRRREPIVPRSIIKDTPSDNKHDKYVNDSERNNNQSDDKLNNNADELESCNSTRRVVKPHRNSTRRVVKPHRNSTRRVVKPHRLNNKTYEFESSNSTRRE